MSNLCTEIFQLQETSIINDYGTEDEIKRDINCNLGSLNIANVMESKNIQEAVKTGMMALTSVADMSNISNAPSVKKANDELKAVGLGVMNLHGYLAKNQIDYDSELAKEFVSAFFMAMNYYSIEASMEIAKETGKTFADFEKSDYANGTYFEKYEQKSYAPTSEKVVNLFEGIHLPTQADWADLKAQVAQHGLYHAYRLAIAPTQSISYVQNATPSVMPIVDVVESRTYANSTTYYPMPYLDMDTFWYYKSAYNTNQMKIIDLVALMQEHVDQGISTILYVNSDISTKELARYYIYANKKGLKSLYYTRTRHSTVEDCLTCSV
jgi:ribonucleoside-diphosphate reductase alpha chain